MAKAKRKARRPNQLYNPLSILSGKHLKRAVDEIVRSEILPGVREINRQISENRASTRLAAERIGSYFDKLAQQNAQSVALGQALGQRAQQALSQMGTETANQIKALADTAAQRFGLDDQVRGPGLSGGARERLARELVAQQGRLASNITAARTSQQLSDQAAVSALQQMAQAQAMRGAELRGRTLNMGRQRERELASKRTQLFDQARGLRSKTLASLRQAGFEQWATGKQLNLKEKELGQQLAIEKMKDRTTRRGQDIDARLKREELAIERAGLDIERIKAEAAMISARARQSGSKSSSSAQKAGRAFANAVNLVREARSRGGKSLADKVIRAYANRIGGGPWIKRALIELAYNGKVSRRTDKAVFDRYGFHPSYWASG